MINEKQIIDRLAYWERTIPNIGTVADGYDNPNKIMTPHSVLHSVPGFRTDSIGYPRRWTNTITIFSALFSWSIDHKGGRFTELENQSNAFLTEYRRKFQTYDVVLDMMKLGTGNPHFSLVGGRFGALPELSINTVQWIGCVFEFQYTETV